jgi:hypothetical protein
MNDTKDMVMNEMQDEIYDTITTLRDDILTALMNPVDKSDSNESNNIEQKFLHPESYYEEKVCVSIHDIDEFEPEIEFVETHSQLDIWNFFRRHTSSVKTHKNIGRNIKLLVRDKLTKKYIGIIAIGSDIYYCGDRDTAIGWSNEQLKENIGNIANIWGCVGLQPISYNYNIGKLLTSLCFTREVLEYYKDKYGVKLAGLTTFGAFGKAIQYERLPYIKLVGFTKGYNINRIPDDLYAKACKLYCKVFNVSNVCNRGGRLDTLLCLFRWFGIPATMLKENGIKRGVYFGFTTPNAKDFLTGKINTFELPDDLPTVNSISSWWKNRWAKQRVQTLKDTNRFQSTVKPKWTWEPLKNHKLVYQRRLYNIEVHEYELSEEEINYYKNIILEDSYIAGFIDGDGTIGYYNSQYSVYISITQCDVRPLLALQEMFGGTIRINHPRTSQERKQYIYNLSKNTKALLKILADNCILKSKRANYCYNILYGDENTHNKNESIPFEEHEKIVNTIKKLQKDYTPINDDYTSRLNDQYIAGLFDAEGYIYTSGLHKKSNGFMVNITQKSNPLILNAIINHLGYGTCKQSHRWNEYTIKNIISFLYKIKPYIIVKKEQAEALFRVYETQINSNNKNSIKHELNLIKQLKHREFKISKDILKELNILGHVKRKNWEKPKCLKPIKIKVKQQRCSKGVPLKYKHRANIALKNSLRSQTITDDMIDAVLNMKNTHTQSAISKELKLSREKIYKIIHGIVIKKSELTLEFKEKQVLKKQNRKDSLTPEKIKELSNINRRKITLDKMVWIMKQIQEPNESPTSLFDKLKEEALRDGIKISYTITPILYIINGKTRPYDSEFPLLGSITKEMYEEWLENIKTKDFDKAHKIQMSKKTRSVSSETILKVYLHWDKNPSLTKTDLARIFNYAQSTLRRFIQNPSLYFSCDFPVEIEGNTYTYQDFLTLAEKWCKK